MQDANSARQALVADLKETCTLDSIGSLLGWDEQVMLRPAGTEHRAEQMSLIARLSHERFTSARTGDLIDALAQATASDPPDADGPTIARETRRQYDRAVKLPVELVEALSRAAVMGHAAWVAARKASNFADFAPHLEKIITLKQREAQCVGYSTGNPYDALLSAYEPGETAAGVANLFDALRPPLVELIARVKDSGRVAPVELIERSFPAPLQERFATEAATRLGFDFNAGRLDVSVHPFCSGMAPGDTRITTRYDEHAFNDAFFGTLHETGHALYEQGLPKAQHFGLPLAEAVSLGIHESQSRMWENLVGRGGPFWAYFFPKLVETFPQATAGVSPGDWLFAVNDIRPSFIRVEADEATYNLHIMLRFELEQAMIRGDLKAADIPGVWNQTMQSSLGIAPPDDARGCLQDVHWSGGAIGYFSTYALGNMYAAQFFEQARTDLPDLDAAFAAGDFAPLLTWLRGRIHRQGRRYLGRELVQRVTGQDLSPDALMRHLTAKAQRYYQV